MKGRRPISRFTFKAGKTLQKLPDSQIGIEDEAILLDIIDKGKIKKEDFLSWSKEAQGMYYEAYFKGLVWLAFNDRDLLVENFSDVVNSDIKHAVWERNHEKIVHAINNHTQEYGRFPARWQIQKLTNLSRQTISKHLKEYYGSNEYKEKEEELLLLREKVLATVYRQAVNGDMRAAALFIDATDPSPKYSRIQNQNFIQINGFTITEELINQLPEDRRVQIQKLLIESNVAIPPPLKRIG